MRISDILLVSLILFSVCGTYDRCLYRRKPVRWLAVLAMSILLATRNLLFSNAHFYLHVPSVLLPLMLLPSMPRRESGGFLIVSVFGGILAWKLSTSYPLFPEPGALTSIVAVALACIYCRSVRAQLFASVCAALSSGLFLFVQDMLLFGYGQIGCGSDVLFDAQVIGVWCLINLNCLLQSIKDNRARVNQHTAATA